MSNSDKIKSVRTIQRTRTAINLFAYEDLVENLNLPGNSSSSINSIAHDQFSSSGTRITNRQGISLFDVS